MVSQQVKPPLSSYFSRSTPYYEAFIVDSDGGLVVMDTTQQRPSEKSKHR